MEGDKMENSCPVAGCHRPCGAAWGACEPGREGCAPALLGWDFKGPEAEQCRAGPSIFEEVMLPGPRKTLTPVDLIGVAQVWSMNGDEATALLA
ncbi:hypothetical protein B0T18DRAFT_254772 [Schizothecium vesticola]|uniref:Uncharacterized protein n=1 Tax=Schizothecium vesticola TaxID=314040 RepID=A0AA40EHG5_9PEZI|nr:hypothetical protein B0T18DRAFT_254772 [Schizothecium vesticola]